MRPSGISIRSITKQVPAPANAVNPVSSTPRPKSLALMFLVGAFLTGGAVGYAADRAVTRAKPARQQDAKSMRDDLAIQLSLSPAQRRAIDTVFDWRRARSKEIMQQYQPMLDSIRDSARVLIMSQLDTTQQTKFKALIEHNKRVADSISKAREGGR